VKQKISDKLIDHHHYISEYGDDMPDINDWTWEGLREGSPAPDAATRTSPD